MTRLYAAVLVAMVLSPACGSDRPSALYEVAKRRADSVDVVVLSPGAALSAGKGTFTIEFRAVSNGRLVDVGTVRANATMPMAGMSPMVGPIDVQEADEPGKYLAASDLSMAGEWRLAVEWNGPAGQGSAILSVMAQ